MKDDDVVYCQVKTRQQEYGSSWASTSWSCSRRATVVVRGRLACRQHAAMVCRDNRLNPEAEIHPLTVEKG